MPRPRKRAYSEGTVYYDKGRDIWIAEYWHEGTRHRRSAGRGSSKTDGTRLLDKLRAEAATGLPIGDDTRLGEWLDWYFETAIEADPDLDPNTVANYKWAFGHLEPLRSKLLRELTTEQVEARLRALANQMPITPAQRHRGGRRRPLGKSSLSRIRTCLGAALNEAERRNRVGRNVARLALLPKTDPPKEKRALTQDDAKKVLVSATMDQDEALFLVALMLGLRPGEVLGLKWKAIDLEERTLDVREALHRRPGGGLIMGNVKADSYRTLRLPSPVVDVLRTHRKDQRKARLRAPVWEDNDLVFCSIIGTPIDFSNLRRTVKRVCERAEVDVISPNEMRHTALTLMMEAGVPMQDAADVVGHDDTRMLAKVYRHKRGRCRRHRGPGTDAGRVGYRR